MDAQQATLFWMFGDTVARRVPLPGPRGQFATLPHRLWFDFTQFASRLLTAEYA